MKLDDLYKSALHSIAEKRTGGKIAIEGFLFQFQYSLYLLLDFLPTNQAKGIRLEGLEDLDVFEYSESGAITRSFYQVKHSINDIAPSQFWNRGILQNFIKVYEKDQDAQFAVVYDMNFKGDALKELAGKSLSDASISYWYKKITKGKHFENANQKEVRLFLNQVSFHKTSEAELQEKSAASLIEHFGINTGNVELFYKNLLQQTLVWSLDRQLVTYELLQERIKDIQKGIEKGSVNNAVKQGWVKEVIFEKSDGTTTQNYYEGISARPIHIADGLPVKRASWEKEVETSLNANNVTVIKASSGQGKSTIAWQVAFGLQRKGHTVYEIMLCDSPNKIGELCSFFEIRCRYLGESPIIILDGLNQLHQSWSLLAEQLVDAPVTLLISSREEDWKRFGTGYSKFRIGFVDLNMSFKEAKNIFTILDKNKMIHPTASNWQTAWEAVEEKGVLIEYIYLLTQGQMLSTRLQEQVHSLNKDGISSDGAAKIEILRLVSLADLCGVTLRTKDVLNYVKDNIGFSSDRGQLVNSLESEYYLTFGAKFIEGLHTVRSEHLFTILHQHVSVTESAINLIPFVLPNQIQIFYSNILSLIDQVDTNEFIDLTAEYFTSKAYPQMVAVCDGLFQFEVQKHWEENKEHYDTIHKSGGIKLALIDTSPWMKRKFVGEMDKIVSGRLGHITSEIEKIKPFNPKENVVYFFLEKSQKQKDDFSLVDPVSGLGDLALWYLKFQVDFNPYRVTQPKVILDLLANNQVEEAVNISDAFFAYKPEEFTSFIESHKEAIFAHLKRATNTLVIEERENDLMIEYVLPQDRITNGNEENVSRLKILKSILPIYDKYCAKAIIPPLELNDYLDIEMLSSATKEMPKENIHDRFQIRINQLWISNIESFYLSASVYDWQHQWITIRKLGLKYIRLLNRAIEGWLEGKMTKFNKLAESIDDYSTKVTLLIKGTKDLPESKNNDLIDSLKDAEKKLNSWAGMLGNVIDQTVNLFKTDKPQIRQVAMRNVTSTFRELSKMQKAFDSAANLSLKYFDIVELKEEEAYWYRRFFNSVQVLVSDDGSRGITVKAKKYISFWVNKEELAFNNNLEIAISTFETSTGFQVIRPRFSLHDETLTTIVIGVVGLELRDLEDEFMNLCLGVLDFAAMKIDFLTIVLVKAGVAIAAWRYNHQFFTQMKKLIEKDIDTELKPPLPINLSEKIIAPLEGVQLSKSLPSQHYDVRYSLLEMLWIFSLYKTKLNKENGYESIWWASMEKEHSDEINSKLDIIRQQYPDKDYDTYLILSREIIEENKVMTNEEFTSLTNQLFQQATKGKV